ncbi:MAG: hypothetical protein K2X91_00020 [Thermoleophilia bacterium]|nr:hypothetical protein [Thermoleophilia bacterium]
MTEVTVIPCEPDPNPTVIERLEETLALAREGRISAVTIAIVYRDGSTGDCRSRLPSIGTMIGAVSVLHARLCALITDKD